MRIAVTCENENGLESIVAQHFGRSPFFAFVDVDGREAKSIEILANPFVTGHAHGQVPKFIRDHNANVILAGGMGRGAINFFEQFGIETATGAAGTIQQTIDNYFKGELSQASPCHHSEGHGHGHDHH
jgi:predicted Fe-Mo cluster-binding NifX family protein